MKGFTLIELMVTVAVLALLLTIGIPSFNQVIRDSRLTAQSNDLLGALMAARSEAVKRNASVLLEPVNSNDWAEGWKIFPKDGSSDDPLRSYQALSGGNTLSCSGSCSQVEFLGVGSVSDTADFTLCDAGGVDSRVINLQLNGKAQVDTGGGGSC